jgi:hypothetical protein
MDLTTTCTLLSNASHYFPWVVLIIITYELVILD